jgi:hypothetical protein
MQSNVLRLFYFILRRGCSRLGKYSGDARPVGRFAHALPCVFPQAPPPGVPSEAPIAALDRVAPPGVLH